MKLFVGIIVIVWSLWLLYSWVRSWLPDKSESFRSLINPSAIASFILGLLFVAAVCVTGVVLVSDGSWAWLILGVTATLAWIAIIEHGPGL